MSSLALSYVVNLLARREYSEFELRNKMQEKEFTEDEIDEKIGQGKANAMKWLHENPAKSDELEAKLRAELVANPEQALLADIEQSNDDSESDF